jgi:hypothetical protein
MITTCASTASKTQIGVKAQSSAILRKHVVVALGGNAILQRGEDMTAENQKKNIKACVSSMQGLLKTVKVTLVHGNGPQVGKISQHCYLNLSKTLLFIYSAYLLHLTGGSVGSDECRTREAISSKSDEFGHFGC